MSPTVPPPDRSVELASLVGVACGPPTIAPQPVNEPMISHWAEAMDDRNELYVSARAAQAAGLVGVIAPPTMLQAWTMRGLRTTLEREVAREAGRPSGDDAHAQMMALTDEEGFRSVVATNCEQHYERQLVPGDRLVSASVIESVSAVKVTALGTGRFVTTRTDFVSVPESEMGTPREGTSPDPAALMARGEPVATMRFRILKYRPIQRVPAAGGDTPASAQVSTPRRPRPALTDDIAFWFEGARDHRLLIQRCTGCGDLRHPPLPACPRCRSFDWDAVESAGRGRVYSFVVVHHPEVPGFEYPLPIGLIELDEGTRLVADLVDVAAADVTVGMAVQVRFVDHDDELTLPVFAPVAGS